MLRQTKTGSETEDIVRHALHREGLIATKPTPDRGVDIIASSPSDPSKIVKIQVKGRGRAQRNNKYRWFQIRTTKRQREEAKSLGLPCCEYWRIKSGFVDAFVLVSLKYSECWVLNKSDIEFIVECNKRVHGKRRDNIEGIQTEMDLDVEHEGKPLTEHLKSRLNNWKAISNLIDCDK